MKLKTIDHFCGDLIPNMMVDGLKIQELLISSQLRMLKDTNCSLYAKRYFKLDVSR